MKKYLYLLFFLSSTLFGLDPQQSFWESYTAALRGDKVAQFQIGVIYERGIGIEQNQTQAAQWYEESARQGYVDAQYNIGIMYASGRGVAKDEGLAMMWLARAAKQKDTESRKLLLKIIDGGLDDDKQSDVKKTAVNKSENIEQKSIVQTASGTLEDIAPVTIVVKSGSMVCDEKNQCTPYKVGSVLTSTKRKGEYYKISGIATKRGWQPYEKEGWINAESVEIRR